MSSRSTYEGGIPMLIQDGVTVYRAENPSCSVRLIVKPDIGYPREKAVVIPLHIARKT